MKNIFKKSCTVMALCGLLIFTGVVNVGATTIEIDPNSNIEMPENLYSDKDSGIIITDLASYSSFYQIQDVSSKEDLTTKIDALIENINSYNKQKKIYDSTTDSAEKEQANTNMSSFSSVIETTRNSIKDLVDNYSDVEENWTKGNSIPKAAITKGNYYVVWAKVTAGTTSYYDYEVYKAIDSTTIATATGNPDTGIETTLLYVGVGILIVVGSYLVINKNKERYE